MKIKKSICWLRRDLRLSDHRSLFESTRQSEETVIVFVFDSKILSHLKDNNDRRITLIVESLREINTQLSRFNSRLITLHGDPTIEIPKLSAHLKIDSVFTNEDYEPYAKNRDLKVKETLATMGTSFFCFKDQVIFSSEEILKSDKTPYRVFTPYKKMWLKNIGEAQLKLFEPDLKKLVPTEKLINLGISLDYKILGFNQSSAVSSVGEKGAQSAFKTFQQSIDQYDRSRDFPALDGGTSHLSPHLRFGTISVRELVRHCFLDHSAGRRTWLSELIWRDFYQMILDRFPHVETKAFLPKYENISWPGHSKHFHAWCEGKTGFPLVDAAMRQLNETGWMHNRLRMVTASFLVKDLLVDWRKGEQYFAEKLLDFDLASNNGGWQWCASTGCDAQPYFRVFNPITQSKKFDPQGEFIRKWVPELREVTGASIHFPAEARKNKIPKNFSLGTDYPKPIVNHSLQREQAISLYRR